MRAALRSPGYDGSVSIPRAVLLCLTFFSAACDDAQPVRDDRPNVILITLDTTRFDRVMNTERSARLAPNLATFANECRRFTQARTVGALTLPAHASMLTGLYPPRHGARANGPQVLPPSAETLAERAAATGYQTAGFVGSLALDRAYGIAQGFEVWDQPALATGRVVGQISERPGSQVADAATRWLSSRADSARRPFFLWAHFFDAHAPYSPPATYLQQADGDPYDGEIAALDAACGSLLAGLRNAGSLENCVVLIIGDHGESLGEHGEATHGLFAYDATLHVPFLLYDSQGDRKGQVDDALVSVVDVYPTLAAAMRLDEAAGLDGTDLFRKPAPSDRLLYFEALEGWRLYGWSALSGWIGADGKYLRSSHPEFYRLVDDPSERQNVWSVGFDEAPYQRAFDALARRPALSIAPSVELDSSTKRELEALGYTTSDHQSDDFPAPGEIAAGRSPADSIGEAQATEDAIAYFVRGRLSEAALRFEGILSANPHNLTAAERLIEIRIAQERWSAALELLQSRAKLPPETIATHRDLARCLTALGRDAEAQNHVRRSLELFIEFHERRGELEEAARFRRILADAPR